MKGLIYKDLLGLKRVAVTMVMLAGFYVLLGMQNRSDGGMVNYFPMLAMIVGMMVPITCAGYDEQCDWDVFGNSLPVSRSQVVMARYGTNLIVIVLAAVMVTLSVLAYAALGQEPFRMENICYPIAASLVYVSIATPIVYRFGVNKSRLILVAIVVIPLIVMLGGIGLMMLGTAEEVAVSYSDAAEMANVEEFDVEIDVNSLLASVRIPLIIGTMAICAGLYALSCWLSIRIYRKKQL